MSNDKSFIEVQFPVSKVSKESYKERKANSGQTLTGLGKWWGRKPLILVRAAILGVLFPVSNDYSKDREIFLKILSMDNEGLKRRKVEKIPIDIIYENLTSKERKQYFEEDEGKLVLRNYLNDNDKQEMQLLAFSRMSYDEKLKYCIRPEQLDEVDKKKWESINAHLNTNVNNIQDLFRELGRKKFGYLPVVGDCFSGGGSIPFEASRLGCKTFASDLNPLAGLLTWAGLNILGESDDQIAEYRKFQEEVYDKVVKQIDEWGIENNEHGWRAKFYIYCTETRCPECGAMVPILPSFVISDKYRTVVDIKYNSKANGFDIEVKNNITSEEMKKYKDRSTIKNSYLICPKCCSENAISSIRKDRKGEDGSTIYGLRRWENNDIISRSDDVFHERLMCIKYIDKFKHKTWTEVLKKPAPATDNSFGKIYYVAPSEEDYMREDKVLQLLRDRFDNWQSKGYLPSTRIEEGEKTAEPIRNRGWSFWHHLFNPRQLLIIGTFMEIMDKTASNDKERIVGLLGMNKCIDRMSRLSMWHTRSNQSEATFSNQALNTLYIYGTRTMSSLYNPWIFNINNYILSDSIDVAIEDARNVNKKVDIWITDPPYADAVNYHELSEFFLAWDQKIISRVFPNWYADSRRALAVKGTGETFNQSMIDIYSNLAKNMPDNGMQIVMFTHQDVSVWADLTMIMWSAGLQVTAAWNIATETESGGLKDGNYVKGTVLLVLRKQTSDSTAYLDELYPEIEEEVKDQIDSMKELEDKEDPNFSDADYLMAAKIASLKVLTSYKNIEDIDIRYELSKVRVSGVVSPIERIIIEAEKIAYDYLIPIGFDSYIWKLLTSEERFYVKGLDLEKNGVYQVGAYQELARGFGVREYKNLLASTKANQARLKTAIEFGTRGIGDTDGFGSSVLRNVLASLNQSIKEEETTNGRNWLKNELPNYWQQRNTIIEILDYISTLGNIENMGHWELEANYARLLCELIRNDGV